MHELRGGAGWSQGGQIVETWEQGLRDPRRDTAPPSATQPTAENAASPPAATETAVAPFDQSWAEGLGWRGMRSVFDALDEGVYVVAPDRRILYWNHSAEQLTGYLAADVVGRRCPETLLRHADDKDRILCRGNCPLHETLCDGQSRQGEVYLQHRAGHRLPVSVRVVGLVNDRDEVVAAAEIFRPAVVGSTKSRELEVARRMAYEDALTGLPNRRFAEDDLKRRLRDLREHDQSLAVLMLDLDRFKSINDEHGHAIGDATLRVVADSLTAGVRAPDVVARWGGEEFLVLISGMTHEDVIAIAERLRILVRHSRVQLPDGGECRVTVSIGGALAIARDTPETLEARADEMMYVSKKAGGNRISLAQQPPPSPGPSLEPIRGQTLPSLRISFFPEKAPQ